MKLRKVLSVLLVLCLLSGSIGLSVLAQDTSDTITYTDYTIGEMPANLMGLGDQTAERELYNGSIRTTSKINRDSSITTAYGSANCFSPHTILATDDITSAPSNGVAGWVLWAWNTSTSKDWFKFDNTKNYVVKFDMKDNNPDSTPATVNFNITNNSNNTLVWSKEFGAGGIKLTGEYKTYGGSFNLPDTFSDDNPQGIAVGLLTGNAKGESVSIDTSTRGKVYVAEEKPYNITLTSPANSASSNSAITLEATLLNQIGSEGYLSQNFTWKVANENGEDVTDSFTVTNLSGTEKVSLLPNDSLPLGEYAAWVKAADLDMCRSFKFNIVQREPSYKEYEVGDMPANLFDCGDDGYNSAERNFFNKAIRTTGKINIDSNITTAYGSADAFSPKTIYASEDLDASACANGVAGWVLWGYNSSSNTDWFKFNNKKNYVVKFDLKDNYLDETPAKVNIGITNNSAASIVWSKEHGTTGFELTGDYKTYAGSFNLPDTFGTGTANQGVMVGFVPGNAAGESVSVDTSTRGKVYVAEEKPYNITLTSLSELNDVSPNSAITLEATLLNQVGLEGYLAQDFKWKIVNEDGENVTDDFTISYLNGTEKVSLLPDDELPLGEYTAWAAQADYDMCRSLKFNVVNTTEERISKLSVTKLGDEIILDAQVRNTDDSEIMFALAEYSNGRLVQINQKTVEPKNSSASEKVALSDVASTSTLKVLIWGDNMNPIGNFFDFDLEYNVSDLDSAYGSDEVISMFETPLVSPLYNNKKAAVSVTFDDGNFAAAQYYDSLFEKNNMHGTAMVVSDWLRNPTTDWANLIAGGRVDIGNHSKAHLRYNDAENPMSAAELSEDITTAYNTLRSWFPNEPLITFATPYCAWTQEAAAEILKNHYANRTGGNGFLSLYPTSEELTKIPSLVVQNTTTAETLNGLVDKAIAEGTWLSLLLHGTNEPNAENPNKNNINKDVAEAHFAYIGSQEEVWAGSMTEVIQYILERDSATATINWIRESAMSLSLTDTLDNARFNFPLTYKINVPTHWSNVTVTQNYESTTVAAFTENGKRYVYINIIPDNGDITLENK